MRRPGQPFMNGALVLGRKVWVQICEANPCSHPYWLQILAARNGHIRLERVSCLDHCTLCRSQPFALVDGALWRGDSPAEVVRAILKEKPAPAGKLRTRCRYDLRLQE